MNLKKSLRPAAVGAAILSAAVLTGCNSPMILGGTQPQNSATVVDNCAMPDTLLLEQAVGQVRTRISNGCSGQFERYVDGLMDIAAADPQPQNAQTFSELLLWAGDHGVIGRQQAREIYTRYFGVKFVTAMGDYNTCSQICPVKQQVTADMDRELLDKERGMVKASGDMARFTEANMLHQKIELMLEATCDACGSRSAGL